MFGYCFDKDGKFTEMILLNMKPIIEKVIKYRDETKRIEIKEKLCELHETIEKAIEEKCTDCVPYSTYFEIVKIPYEEEIFVGLEPVLPSNCTLEVCPDLIYDPVFKDGKWIKLKPELPQQPEPGPSEMDKLKAELAVTKAAMAEFIMQQTLKGMGM
ncbi:hypothetical protein [Bacillus cereus]|uniref:hypothetical protein n=1 Tax=Bacillus cereus TaxID=1396 RepID=UPI003A8E84AA